MIKLWWELIIIGLSRGNSRQKLHSAFRYCPWWFNLIFSKISFIKSIVNMLWTRGCSNHKSPFIVKGKGDLFYLWRMLSSISKITPVAITEYHCSYYLCSSNKLFKFSKVQDFSLIFCAEVQDWNKDAQVEFTSLKNTEGMCSSHIPKHCRLVLW